MDAVRTYSAFAGERCLASGELDAVLRRTKAFLDREPKAGVLVFDESTGRQVEFDFRGTIDEVLERELRQPVRAAGPGRPKLGVISREVSLLPKHWDYLEAEPNGISAALRRLVEAAMKRNSGTQRARLALEATGRFMTTMAGDLPGFEEALRALYAKDHEAFEARIRKWPKDIRKQLQRMARSGQRLEMAKQTR
jgi:hypothetical protein